MSLPVMQELCNNAYSTKGIIEQLVLTNNLNWKDFLKPLVLNKANLVSGMEKVRFHQHARYTRLSCQTRPLANTFLFVSQ